MQIIELRHILYCEGKRIARTGRCSECGWSCARVCPPVPMQSIMQTPSLRQRALSLVVVPLHAVHWSEGPKSSQVVHNCLVPPDLAPVLEAELRLLAVVPLPRLGLGCSSGSLSEGRRASGRSRTSSNIIPGRLSSGNSMMALPRACKSLYASTTCSGSIATSKNCWSVGS